MLRVRGAACRLVCLMAALVLSACEPASEYDQDCDLPYDGSDAEGSWEVTGEGTRVGCSDPDLNGDLTLHLSMPLQVRATRPGEADAGPAPVQGEQSEADAFVEAIAAGRADSAGTGASTFDLWLDGADGGLQPDGFSDGSCVDVRVDERVGDVVQVVHFAGSVRRRGTIKGTFSGDGPGTCSFEGEFDARVR